MIVVDASVAVKWTVAEDLHGEAVSLARGDHALIAPDLIVIETLNVLRRKVKRAEIDIEQVERAADQLAEVFDLLVPNTMLSRRIVALSSDLDHSVYDCAYLACALEYDAPMVTADAHFARKVAASTYRDSVLQLVSGMALPVGPEQTMSVEERALHLWQVFDQTISHVRGLVTLPFGSSGMTVFNTGELRPAFESPSYVRLNRFVSSLAQSEQARLLAIAWFGRPYIRRTWSDVLSEAEQYVAMQDPTLASYVIQTFGTLAAGLEKLRTNAPSHSEKP